MKYSIKAALLAALFSVAGCQTFMDYCDETEARAALRAINPWDVIDAAGVGACATAGVYYQEGMKVTKVTFVKAVEDQQIPVGAVGQLMQEHDAGVTVRVFGKTMIVDADHVEIERPEGDGVNGDGSEPNPTKLPETFNDEGQGAQHGG